MNHPHPISRAAGAAHQSESTGLSIDPLAAQVMNRAVIVTGAGRTGTTVMGQLIHSLAGVEYSFEPPLAFGLLALIDTMPEEHWKLLFDLYLFEDLFVESMSGRRLTFNPRDTSYIYNVKTREEVEQRFAAPRRRTDFFRLLQTQRQACKITDLVPHLRRMAGFYPSTKFVALVRDPLDVAASIIGRGWFSDRTLTGTAAIWPFVKVREYQVPFWLKPDDREFWIGCNEIDRCLFYFTAMYGDLSIADTIRVIDYDRFVLEPVEQFRALTDWLGASHGEFTAKILADVKPRMGPGTPAPRDEADEDLLARATEIHAAWRNAAARQLGR